MPKSNKSVAESRPESRKLIEKLLAERQQMLVLYWELSKLEGDTIDEALTGTLSEFVDILVDYIAAGHFGLYQRIAEGNERRQAVLEAARDTYPEIARSSDIAVEFSERYEAPSDERLHTNLMPDLSRLGEVITTRVEHEDRLILAMLGPEYDIPQAPARA